MISLMWQICDTSGIIVPEQNFVVLPYGPIMNITPLFWRIRLQSDSPRYDWSKITIDGTDITNQFVEGSTAVRKYVVK